MNLPLRRRHRRVVMTLAVLVPVLYLSAIQARRDVPTTNAIVETVSRVGRLDGTAREVETDWDGASMQVRLWSDGAILELLPEADPARPDVLVYWTEAGEGAETPSDGAYLLGTLAGAEPRRFVLPDVALSTGGRLLLWSLAHSELVASAALPATGGER